MQWLSSYLLFIFLFELQEITVEYEYVSMNLHENAEGEVRLHLGVKNGFQVIELDGGSASDIIVDESFILEKGLPVGTVSLEKGGVLLCFEEYGFPIHPTGEPAGKAVKWRARIQLVCKCTPNKNKT